MQRKFSSMNSVHDSIPSPKEARKQVNAFISFDSTLDIQMRTLQLRADQSDVLSTYLQLHGLETAGSGLYLNTLNISIRSNSLIPQH